ncbi:hypothetical protein ACF0H5_021973 [Mactra antiquata]
MKPSSWHVWVLLFTTLLYGHTFVAGFACSTNYSGYFHPRDPKVCVAQPLTFTCTLLSEPDPNKSIVFFTKNSFKYIEVNNTDVTVHNSSVSEFTMLAPEKQTVVRCYYTEPTNGTLPHCNLQLSVTSTILPSYESNITIDDFQCIAYNYLERMNCSWKYAGQYDKAPNILFKWKIPAFNQWETCPELNTEYKYCNWPSTSHGDFSMKKIVIEIDINYITCDNSVVNKTFKYSINTRDIVKPNPVTSLRREDSNSTCITLAWSLRSSRPEYPKIQKIEISSHWGSSIDPGDILINTPGVSTLQEDVHTVCNLQEYTIYTFTVSMKPEEKGYWSTKSTVVAETQSAVPSASPNITVGGYSWNPSDCQSDTKRKVCIMIQPISPIDQNGDMKGIRIFVRSKTSIMPPTPTAEDSLFFCNSQLLCNESYEMAISPYNDKGQSKENATIFIQKWDKDVIQPSLRVDLVNSTTGAVHLQWSHPARDGITGYIVYLCTKEQGGCKMNNGTMEWYEYDSNVTDVSMNVEAPEQLSYGVSLITGAISSGLQWVTCIFTANACPTERVQGLTVTPGEEDNTLNVDWDKLPCKSGQPYIDAYIITYCRRGVDCKEEIVNADRSAVVLYNLEEINYLVRVRGVNENGCGGPDSEIVNGKPVNKALKPAEIGGIVSGSIILCIFAGCGIFWFFRNGKAKFQRFKGNLSGIKMPEMKDVTPEENNDDGVEEKTTSTDSTIVRQISNDSGVPETPKYDSKNPLFTQLPDGYCISTNRELSDVNENSKEPNIFLNGIQPSTVMFVHDSSHPSSLEKIDKSKDVKISKNDVDHSETSGDYGKATLDSPTSDASDEDSNTTSKGKTESSIVSDTSINTRGFSPEPRLETLQLTSIPKPEGYKEDSNCSFDNTSNGNITDDINSAKPCVVTQSLASATDSYVKPSDANGVDDLNSDQSLAIKPKSVTMCSSEGTQSNTLSDDYMKSSVLYDNDGTKSDHVCSPYIGHTCPTLSGSSNSGQPNSSVESSDQLNRDQSLSNSNQSESDSDQSMLTVNHLETDSHSNQSQADKHGSQSAHSNQSQSNKNGSQSAHSPSIITTCNPYTESPIQYDENVPQSEEQYEFSGGSDFLFNGEQPHIDIPSDGENISDHTKLPYVFSSDPPYKPENTNPYIQSPVKYGENTSDSNLPVKNNIQASSPYIQSPLQYDIQNSQTTVVPDVTPSIVTTGAGPSSTDVSSNPYITSPLPYDHNNVESNQSPFNSKSPTLSVTLSQDFNITPVDDNSTTVTSSNSDYVHSNGSNSLPRIGTIPIPVAIETVYPENGSTNISDSLDENNSSSPYITQEQALDNISRAPVNVNETSPYVDVNTLNLLGISKENYDL